MNHRQCTKRQVYFWREGLEDYILKITEIDMTLKEINSKLEIIYSQKETPKSGFLEIEPQKGHKKRGNYLFNSGNNGG